MADVLPTGRAVQVDGVPATTTRYRLCHVCDRQSASSGGGSEGWQSGYVQDKRGLNTKIHLAVDANGMPVRILITEGTRADCKEAVHLIEGISAEILLADRGYDTNDIREST